MGNLINLLKQAVERLERADREIMAAIEYAGNITDEDIRKSYPYWWEV